MKTNSNIDIKNLGELLNSYYQGKLSHKELQEIDSLKNQDEFLADAMQGYDKFPEAINDIPSYKSGKTIKVWISTGVIAMLALAVFFMFNSPKPVIKNTLITEVIHTESTEKEELVEIEKPETIQKEIIIPITQIKPKKEKSNETMQVEKETLKRDYFEIPKMELNPIEIKQKTDYTIKKAKTKSLLYHNFLAIDYSVIYANTIPVEQELSGIDASKPNKEEQGIETGNGAKIRTITYKEQLKNSLYELKSKNYTTAIQNFEIILTHFPQDANAEFYIGYALFYQKKYEEAVLYFERTMANDFDFFFEDAEWFKANSLENMGELKEAQVLYQTIKNKKGYYSYQVR